MNNAKPYHDFRLECEVLRARLEICENHIHILVREVYENITQVLSLAKMQLAFTHLHTVAEQTAGPDALLAKAISDLRSICRSYYAYHQLAGHDGFVTALRRQLLLDNRKELSPPVEIKGKQQPLRPEISVLAFSVLQNMFTLMKDRGELVRFEMCYQLKKLVFVMDYQYHEQAGEGTDRRMMQHFDGLIERSRLVNGSLQINTHPSGWEITFLIPYQLYE